MSKKLTILLYSMMFLTIHVHAQDNVSENALTTEDTSIIGRWVQDGPAIKEYPVCYQLWQCESGKPIMGESISLPKGEWGLCDNYTDTSNNICTKCDAPPPIEVCE